MTHTAYNVQDGMEPSTHAEAINGPQGEEWMKVTNQEHQSLLENNTWELCDLPEDRKAIDCKWIFKVKYHANGKIERFKSTSG